MSYKNLQHYRNTVHLYLDGIWLLSKNKKQARNTMYNILSIKMNISKEDTHVSKFNRAQCKEAIRILRPMYMQLYGRDIPYKPKEKSDCNDEKICDNEVKVEAMYYVEKSFDFIVKYVDEIEGQEAKVTYDNIKTVISCKAKSLYSDGSIVDYSNIAEKLEQIFITDMLNNILDGRVTYEKLAKWICDQVVVAYKVTIITTNGEKYIYEEY